MILRVHKVRLIDGVRNKSEILKKNCNLEMEYVFKS